MQDIASQYLDGDQLDTEQTERAAALFLAAEILHHDVPRPKVKKVAFTHEVIELADYILYGPKPGEDD